MAKRRAVEPSSLHSEWLDEIHRYEQESDKFERRGKETLRRYRDERSKSDYSTRFNSLWANIQTLLPALYSKDPQPRVTRRFKDADKVARTTADVIERCLSYAIECWGFGDTMRATVKDRLLPGRGTAWIRYVPHFSMAEQTTDDVSEDADSEPEQELEYEEVLPDYVHWQDFGHTFARTWEEVRGLWRITYMTRKKGVARFGKIFNQVELDYSPSDDKRSADKNMTEQMKRACVYEIWDKDTKKVLWMTKAYDTLLDERDDPLGLDGFFPCPKPMFANLVNETIIPTADYFQYQDQSRELDELTNRIANITKTIKVAGAYNGQVEGLSDLLTEGAENILKPVAQWSKFAEGGGLKGAIDLLPMKEIAETLNELYLARDKVKQDMYEVTGLSDIVRGFSSDTDKTATEQQLKSQYSNLRLSEMQQEVQRFARDLLRLMGQVIASKFQQKTIAEMSGLKLMTDEEKQKVQGVLQQYQQITQQAQQAGQPPPPPPVSSEKEPELMKALNEPSWDEVMKLIRNQDAFGFRIDIETDSTIATDEKADKEMAVEALTAIGQFADASLRAEQAGVMSPKVASEILISALRKFRFSPQVEEVIEQEKQNPQQQQGGPQAAQLQQAQQQLQEQQQQVQAEGEKVKGEKDKVTQDSMRNQQDKAMMDIAAQKQQLVAESAVNKVTALVDSFTAQVEGIVKTHETAAASAKEGEQNAQTKAASDAALKQVMEMHQTLVEAASAIVAVLQAPPVPKQAVRPDGSVIATLKPVGNGATVVQ